MEASASRSRIDFGLWYFNLFFNFFWAPRRDRRVGIPADRRQDVCDTFLHPRIVLPSCCPCRDIACHDAPAGAKSRKQGVTMFRPVRLRKAISGDSSDKARPIKPVRAYISVATGGPTFQHNPVKGCISDGYGNVLVTRCI